MINDAEQFFRTNDAVTMFDIFDRLDRLLVDY